MKYMDDESPEFMASNGFIYNFKKHHGFSSRAAHYKRRPVTDSSFVEKWKAEIRQVFKTVPRDHILNCDETSFPLGGNLLKGDFISVNGHRTIAGHRNG